MSQPLDADLWCTQIPDGWVAEAEDESILVFHPDGAGTLQFTCSEMEEGLVDDEDTGEWVQEWYLAADDLFFFITYSCPRTARGSEDEAVAAILGALALND